MAYASNVISLLILYRYTSDTLQLLADVELVLSLTILCLAQGRNKQARSTYIHNRLSQPNHWSKVSGERWVLGVMKLWVLNILPWTKA